MGLNGDQDQNIENMESERVSNELERRITEIENNLTTMIIKGVAECDKKLFKQGEGGSST